MSKKPAKRLSKLVKPSPAKNKQTRTPKTKELGRRFDLRDGDVYEAEKIVGKKVAKNGAVLYVIKWKGYSHKHNTLEPRRNLPSSLIEEFVE